ncbi:hypothetical protein B0T17DRAFT_232542 [Bombardia bombarda]|uniref:GPI anchored serine-rich protein n=1 Tax=Bombardia bombarda TaxID=252184 RepID=A0AA39XBV9_9PEZI|nr:hypothetical protein B0T17DRAFT_232542 [Bombardia bombarda]
MRFALAAVAFAAAVFAQEDEAAESTVYSTDYVTITSCAATVTDCPARSTQVSSTVYAVTTGVVIPSQYSNSTIKASSAAAVFTPVVVAPSAAAVPSLFTTVAPACPTYSVKTISTEITTVIPTVYYETVAIPCPTVAPTPSAGFPASSSNGTTPTFTSPPAIVTAGAATMGGSAFLAAAAGLAAFVLA